MKNTPDYVFRHGKTESDWFEQYDSLTFSTSNPFDVRNQEDYWLKNVYIREAILQIEKEVRLLIKEHKKVSIGIASWQEISKRSKCDRKTLIYDKASACIQRRSWVTNLRNKLRELIKNYNIQISLDESTTVDLEEQSLQSKIANLRTENAKLYYKLQLQMGWNEELMRLVRKYVPNFTDIYKVYKKNEEDTSIESTASPIFQWDPIIKDT